jgi:hypothetical protein
MLGLKGLGFLVQSHLYGGLYEKMMLSDTKGYESTYILMYTYGSLTIGHERDIFAYWSELYTRIFL